jgi:hypothetical protein
MCSVRWLFAHFSCVWRCWRAHATQASEAAHRPSSHPGSLTARSQHATSPPICFQCSRHRTSLLFTPLMSSLPPGPKTMAAVASATNRGRLLRAGVGFVITFTACYFSLEYVRGSSDKTREVCVASMCGVLFGFSACGSGRVARVVVCSSLEAVEEVSRRVTLPRVPHVCAPPLRRRSSSQSTALSSSAATS